MNTINQILDYLQGKKTIILAIIGLVLPFAMSKGYIDQELGALISGIIAILLGGVKIVEQKMGRAK